MISQASISRFIRKIGYSSFEEFKECFEREFDQLYDVRNYQHTLLCEDKEGDTLKEWMFEKAKSNLECTYQALDMEKLKHLAQTLDQARFVSILGDLHVQEICFTLQLDLMARGVPTYMYSSYAIRNMHFEKLKPGGVLLCIAAAHPFISPEERKILETYQNNSDIIKIGILQDPEDSGLFDHVLLYGKPHTLNDGFYSLQYISQLLSETLYTL